MLALASSAAMVAEVAPAQYEKASAQVLNVNGMQIETPSRVKADPQVVQYYFPKAAFHYSGYPILSVPANVPVVWPNLSVGFTEADTFEWTYPDPNDPSDNPQSMMVEGQELELVYPVGITNVPSLKCGDATYTAQFKGNDGSMNNLLVTPGLTPAITGFDGTLFNLYNMHVGDCVLASLPYFSAGASEIDNANQFWKDQVFGGVFNMPITSAKVTGYTTVIEQPAAPYVLNRVCPSLNYTSSAAFNITLDIYAASKDSEGFYQKGEKLTSTVVEFPAGMVTYPDKAPEFVITGPVDPVTGLQADFLKINTPVVLEFTGFANNPSIEKFSFLEIFHDRSYVKATNHYTGGLLMNVVDDQGQQVDMEMSLAEYPYAHGFQGKPEGTWYRAGHFVMDLDAYYPYVTFYSESLEPLNSYQLEWNAPVAGGNIMYVVESNDNDESGWFLTDENGEDVASWVKAELGNVTVQGQQGPFQMPTLTLTAEALPSDVNGRSAVVRVNAALGGVNDIKVVQGAGGVSAVIAEEIGVAVDGENFVIKANAEVNSVNVYNLAGQLVKTAELSAGNNVVAAGDLAKGVYVLKFNNNHTVKAVK